MSALTFSVWPRSSLIQAGLGGLMVVLGLATGGCTSRMAVVDAQAPAVTDEPRAVATAASIETVHRQKCGHCHTRVEPGSLPRTAIETAMVRHRRRAKLSEGQWGELIEFLSAGRTEPRHTASLP